MLLLHKEQPKHVKRERVILLQFTVTYIVVFFKGGGSLMLLKVPDLACVEGSGSFLYLGHILTFFMHLCILCIT